LHSTNSSKYLLRGPINPSKKSISVTLYNARFCRNWSLSSFSGTNFWIYSLVNALIEKQEFQRASSVYENILNSTTESKVKVRVFIQLAQIYAYHLNRVDDAVKLINNAILLANNPTRLIKLNEILGDIYFSNLRSFKKSAAIYNELIEIKPRLSNFYEYKYRFAESLFLSNSFHSSLNAFVSLEKEFPKKNLSKIKFRIALINYFLKNYQVAQKLFKEIIDGDFSYSYKVKSSFYLAGIYEETNQMELAFKYYNIIKYDYPNSRLIKQKIDSVGLKIREIGLWKVIKNG